jgi:uncharacterized DUF497 family protein
MLIWDEDKNTKLKLERNVSFELISEIILNETYVAVLDHPKKQNQNIFVLEINNYIYAVPFIINKNSDIILKTAYPSRKLHKKYKEQL